MKNTYCVMKGSRRISDSPCVIPFLEIPTDLRAFHYEIFRFFLVNPQPHPIQSGIRKHK